MMPDRAEEKPKIKWYLKPVAVVIAILIAGPFAIPLVWISPAFKGGQKIAITIVLVLLTIWMFNAAVQLCRILTAEMKDLQNTLR